MTEESTRQFVDVQEIRDDVIILKDGSLRQLVEVGSTNFELKSQDEQMAILQRFKGFLNSLDFSLEILLLSRKLNINEYLSQINQLIEQQQNELLKIQAVEYSRFIRELTQLANIMSKNFYVTTPFYIGPTSPSKGIKETITSILKPSEVVKKLTPEEFESYKNQLRQRTDLVIDGLSALGLSPKILNKDEIANLYYKLYNPEATEKITI